MSPTPHACAADAVRVRPASDAADRAAWDEHVLERCRGGPLGTWGWGELRRRFGWEVVRLVAEEEGRLTGVMWLQLRRGPLGVGFAYAPRGPLVADTTAGAAPALALIAAASREARRRRALLLKLDPEWREDDPGAARILAAARLRDSWYDVQHRKTYLVDLGGGADAVLARVKESTRRNVRTAQRKGVVIELREDPPAAGELHPLLVESGRRNGFEPRDAAYFTSLVELVGRSCPAITVLARTGGELCSGLIALACGPRLVYLYGGSSLAHPESRTPYAAQWAAIRWGVEHGCTEYDMWGVPNHEDPSRPGFGYYEFKTRWNGRVVRHIRCQEARLRPLGPLPRWAERLALRDRTLLT